VTALRAAIARTSLPVPAARFPSAYGPTGEVYDRFGEVYDRFGEVYDRFGEVYDRFG